MHVNWELNGKPFAKGPDQITLSNADIDDYATLTATVFDSTTMSRKDKVAESRSWTFKWNLESNLPKVFKIKSTADSVCVGEPVTLTASGCPGAVQWSTGENGNSISIKANATLKYEATCKVAGQADSTIGKTITALPLPLATASNSGPYFEGATIELNAKGGVAYNWKGPVNFSSNTQTALIPTATTANAGTYEVKVTDLYGCASTASTNVTVDPILAVGQEPGDWLQVSPNPSRDFVKVSTTLPGESVFTIYDLAGRKLWVKSFSLQTQIKLNAVAGMYLYRFRNGEKTVLGKLLVQ